MTDESRTPDLDPSQPDHWDDVARQLSGETAPVSGREILAAPGDREFVEKLARSTQRIAAGATINTEAALRSVKARMRSSHQPQGRVVKMERPSRVNWRVLVPAIAAVALVAVGVNRIARPPIVAYDSITNGIGRVRQIPLSDGSVVVLGPQSTLTIAGDYAKGNRTVDLTGDGYFEVRHDEKHPFTVTAGGATIHDIGTKFTVTASDQSVAVAVTEGSVRLASTSRQAAVLQQGDRGKVKGASAPVVERHVVTDDDIAWTRKTLVFRDTPIGEVRESLLRWYGIQLTVADATLESRHLTATFNNESPARVLEVIGLALGVDIERKGDTAFIRRSKGPSR